MRQRFDEALQQRVAAAEPGSLAALLTASPASPGTVPHQQVPQWLFAFDAAAMATIRALALLASSADQAARVRDDLDGRDLSQPQDLSLLRACVLESLRLWPTTPVILRDTTAETTWETGVLPAGTAVVVYAPLFHRDDRRLAEADRFSPGLWSAERRLDDWPLVPFSGGPAECPGRNLVLLVTSTVLAALLSEHDMRLLPAGKLDPRRPLPGTLSPFGLRFKVKPRAR